MRRKMPFNFMLRTVRRHQHFRATWQMRRFCNAKILPSVLRSKRNNITLYKPQELYTTYTNYQPVNESDVEPDINLESLIQNKEYHVITDTSEPLWGWGVASIQHLTNTYVYNSLPSIISNCKKVESDIDLVKGILLYSQLLNTTQSRIRTLMDPNIFPKKGPIHVAIPRPVRMSTFSLHLLNLLDKLTPIDGRRIVCENSYQNTYTYNELNVFMDLTSHVHLTANKPLPPILNSVEVQALSDKPLPDLYPMSPLANFSAEPLPPPDNSKIPGNSFPHTLIIHRAVVAPDFRKDTYVSLALLNCFNTAATYARKRNEDPNGDLKEPITVNVILHNGRHFQLGVLQLNTLNLNGPTRNVFWYEDMQMMFSNVIRDEGIVLVEDYNHHPFEVIKQMYQIE